MAISSKSCPARGMGVEIVAVALKFKKACVMPREGHGSRNIKHHEKSMGTGVMPREGHGSRNSLLLLTFFQTSRHAPRGAWE